MNWATWGPDIVAVVTAIFTAGMIAGRVRNQEKLLHQHEGRLDGHDRKLEDHAIKLAMADSWRQGYNVGKGLNE